MMYKFLSAALVALGFAAPTATLASVIKIEATSTVLGIYTDFSILFEDSDRDGLLSLDEIQSFSGVLGNVDPPNPPIFFHTLTHVPIIADISDGSDGGVWGFDSDTFATFVAPGAFVYRKTAAVVPLPGAFLLLLSAVTPIFLLRK